MIEKKNIVIQNKNVKTAIQNPIQLIASHKKGCIFTQHADTKTEECITSYELELTQSKVSDALHQSRQKLSRQ